MAKNCSLSQNNQSLKVESIIEHGIGVGVVERGSPSALINKQNFTIFEKDDSSYCNSSITKNNSKFITCSPEKKVPENYSSYRNAAAEARKEANAEDNNIQA